MNIVVIDASSTVRIKINELLTEMDSEHLDIECFSDAGEAYDYIEENDINLIFSSIETIGMDGTCFVDKLLREYPEYTSKLFIVTSQKNNDAFEDMKGVGAKRFIRKPINEEYFNHFVVPEIKKILK